MGRFVGRARELEILRSAISDVTDGRPRVVFVVGDAGIGKTALLEEGGRLAVRAGATLAMTGCLAAAGTPPLFPWARIARRAGRERSDRSAPLHAGLAHLVEGRANAPRFEVFEAMFGLLQKASEAAPLMVVLDDLHDADPASVLLLEHVIRELSEERVLVVAALRSTVLVEGSPLEQLCQRLASRLTRIDLAGLAPTDVADLIEERGRRYESSVLANVLAKTAGNPFFIQKWLDGIDGGLSPDVIPPAVRDAVRDRLGSLPKACIKALEVAAVMGTEIDEDAVTAVAATPPDEWQVAAARARLIERRADGTLAFVHALVPATLSEDLGGGERRLIHARLGRWLAARPPSERRPAAIGEHLERGLGADPTDEERALASSWLERAGRAARAAFGFERAAEHFRSASRLAAPYRAGRLLLLEATAREEAGDTIGATRTYELAWNHAEELGDADLRAEAALGLGGRLPWGRVGLPPHGVRRKLEVALHGSPLPDTLRAKLLARLGCTYRFTTDERRETLTREALSLARTAGDEATLGFVLGGRHHAIWTPFNTEERLELANELVDVALSAEDVELQWWAYLFRRCDLFELGEMAQVDIERSHLGRIAAISRQPLFEWYLVTIDAGRLILSGDLDQADELLQVALDRGRKLAIRDAEVFVGGQLYGLRRSQGRSRDATDVMRALIELVPEMFPYRAMLALSWAETGLREESRRLLDELMGAGLDRLVAFPAALVALAEASAILGEDRHAARLYEVLAPLGRRPIVFQPGLQCFALNAHALGLLARTGGDRGRASAHFQDACEDAARLGAPLLERLSAAALDEVRRVTRGPSRSPLHRALPSPANRIQRTGAIWGLSYAGVTAHLRDSKGLRYLEVLLTAPRREHHVVDLLAASDPPPVSMAPETGCEQLDTRGRSDLARAPEVSPDAMARASYRARLLVLQEELSAATLPLDEARAVVIEEEIALLSVELGRVYGLRGEFRANAERARKAVTNRIRAAIARIGEVHLALGRHLETTIRTGTFCCYEPEQTTAWTAGVLEDA